MANGKEKDMRFGKIEGWVSFPGPYVLSVYISER
jgi:hypothetical protein